MWNNKGFSDENVNINILPLEEQFEESLFKWKLNYESNEHTTSKCLIIVVE